MADRVRLLLIAIHERRIPHERCKEIQRPGNFPPKISGNSLLFYRGWIWAGACVDAFAFRNSIRDPLNRRCERTKIKFEEWEQIESRPVIIDVVDIYAAIVGDQRQHPGFRFGLEPIARRQSQPFTILFPDS